VKRITISIELFAEGDKVSFYTLVFESDKPEIEKFRDENKSGKHQKDYKEIMSAMASISSRGAFERNFRWAGKYKDKAAELPDNQCFGNRLRLYCLHISENVVIVGNGGHKPQGKRTYQKIPFLNECVETLQKVDAEFQKRVRNREIVIEDKKLSGNLKFTIKI